MSTGSTAPKVAAGLALLALLCTGCLKREKYPNEPIITLEKLAFPGDSTVITIGFTDGDGDLGLNEADTFPPYDPDGAFYYNLYFDPERLVNGVWTPVDLPYYYRFTPITPDGQDKSLKGEMDWTLRSQIFPLPPLQDGDTVRFKIKLVDRALNVSNTVVTDGFRVQ